MVFYTRTYNIKKKLPTLFSKIKPNLDHSLIIHTVNTQDVPSPLLPYTNILYMFLPFIPRNEYTDQQLTRKYCFFNIGQRLLMRLITLKGQRWFTNVVSSISCLLRL